MSVSSTATFTAQQIAELKNYSTLATQADHAGQYSTAMQDLESYYKVQFGLDGYSQLAYDVVSDQTLNGMTPNDELAMTGITYGGQQSVDLMQYLAFYNLQDIIANGYVPPTESQIESEHLQAYSTVGISIEYWGATGLANAGLNWLGTLATPQELSNLDNSSFTSLPASVVDQSLENVVIAGAEAALTPDLYNILGSGIEHLTIDDPNNLLQLQDDASLLLQTNFSVKSAIINFANGLDHLGGNIGTVINSAETTLLNLLLQSGEDVESANSLSSYGTVDITGSIGSEPINFTLFPSVNPTYVSDISVILTDNSTFSTSHCK